MSHERSGHCLNCNASVEGQSECDRCSSYDPSCSNCDDKGYTETPRPCELCKGSGRSTAFKGEACENCNGYEDPDDTIKTDCDCGQ